MYLHFVNNSQNFFQVNWENSLWSFIINTSALWTVTKYNCLSVSGKKKKSEKYSSCINMYYYAWSILPVF